MYRFNKYLKLGLLIITVVLIATTGCAAKKSPWASKHSKASRVNASTLGRNKFYFSVNYQKKLTRNVKKR